jgi:hypothetical protein
MTFKFTCDLILDWLIVSDGIIMPIGKSPDTLAGIYTFVNFGLHISIKFEGC